MRRSSALLATLLAFACQARPEPAPDLTAATPQPASERPTIEFIGCRHVAGSRCHLLAKPEQILRLWVDVQARAPLRVELDGAVVEPESVAVDGGQRLRVTVPETAAVLKIEGVDPPWTEAFELQIVRESVPAIVDEAREHHRAGESELAIERLRVALDELDGLDRLLVLQLLRRLLGPVDRRAAFQRTKQAAALARSLGRTRDFADCASAAAKISMIDRGELVAARQWTQQLQRAGEQLPEARVWAGFYGGVLAAQTGDLSRSVRAFNEARRLADHLDMVDFRVPILEQLTTVLAKLGRGDEVLLAARELLAHANEAGISCTNRARILGNTAWINLLLAQAGHEHDPPRPLLEQQLALAGEGGECPNPNNGALINLTIVALADHEPEQAWEWLRMATATEVPRYLRSWAAELEAQIAVATGREALIPALVRRPKPGVGEPGLRWMALVRQARTLEGFGLDEAAIDTYLEAEAVLDRTLTHVNVASGSELYLAGRQASIEGLVDLLVRRGEVEQGFCRARLARGRALRTIDRAAMIAGLSAEQKIERETLLFQFLALQKALAAERRDDWKFSAPERVHRERRRAARVAEASELLDQALRLVGDVQAPPSCDDLAPVIDGELILSQFPRAEANSENGTWIFIADSEGLTVHAAPEPPRSPTPAQLEQWADAVLEPVADRIAEARLIRVVPTGSGWSLPFHALPFADGVLLDAAPVVYALDLPARAQRPAAPPKAVIVANPSDDLRYAREEAREVERQLAAAGWSVEHRVGSAATRASLAESLTDATLLHYAGHGVHGGVDGWGAALLLHDGDRVGVSDILAFPRVPETVVLTGCDTATVNADTLAGGMNLSRAFVLAGASWVLAADGKVDDQFAREIGVSLYDQAVQAGRFDGPEALRQAQLRLRADYPESWAAFRVIVR